MLPRFPLHVHISTLFLLLLLVVGSLIGVLGYSTANDILKDTAGEMSNRIGREAESALVNLLAPAEMATRLFSRSNLTAATTLEQRLVSLPLMREALRQSAALNSLYIGYGNGDFFLLLRLENDAERHQFDAPAASAYMVRSIDRPDGQPRGLRIFLDDALNTLRIDEEPDYPRGYDPRKRSWYRAAQASAGQVKTGPYVFYTTRQVGINIANRSERDPTAVVGADVELATLDDLLLRQLPTPGSDIALVDKAGHIIAYHRPRPGPITQDITGKAELPPMSDLTPILRALAPRLGSDIPRQGGLQDQSIDGATWHTAINPVALEGAEPLYLITAIPDRELMVTANRLLAQALFAILFVMILAIPATWMLARGITGPLRKLAGEAESIRHFDFAKPITVDSLVTEITELAKTMASMKRTIRRFLDISATVAGESDFTRLLPSLLSETISAAEAEAGILYLADDDNLTPAAALFGNGTPLPGTVPAIATASGSPLVVALSVGRASGMALAADEAEALGLTAAAKACSASHVIAVPLLNRQDVLVGAVLLFTCRAADEARISFVEALSGSAAVSLENKALIHEQKALFEAMIQLIAGAIDAKSPYTGGHCARVPELTKMLVQAACAAEDGLYKDFQLDDAGWEAVHVAAWLHDCGKVTTPEYVVDKATKLETLYDRIHEVRMRFEVLKRDAEIACLKAIAAGTPETEARAKLAAEWQALDADFAFIAECNEGGEFMAPERLARLQEIAGRTWRRTLDDRIGISHEEKERKARTPAPALPVDEPLLADRPDHRFERGPGDRMPSDNRWGFRMTVPELLYDKGELHNLSVARGTLSAEERYKINEHMVQTFMMLTALPFPKHLREVPEIASCHHETMDGKGYPRRLVREQMGPVARMMAIADIFEALTAVDRPYKKGKTLTESLAIMARMRDTAHIDEEQFELFLRAGVWRDYAARFMRPEQIDTVDIETYLSTGSR
ncbi:HD domain-containing phosphohydrolase [Azonexus sp.]|jgi:HD-GYP domain-containing protein (c-di-GMP phosphodiesterase class II)/HAMP domain-containing protein|uniref:HD domain-containing phosphohydrolase n=1 Tax=Azonexus sp. TaxID=1872668 RepID=UPI0028280F53|nr:HD domain-containing phosphohydrolase [Azonexus sp.]MDR1995791.1 HAMP domain-containing protein [Azonexus sp.]